ncbi:MAG TPA: FAD-dependent oxidoreductase [Planctomycetota bacterium]|nr:FAD-dependent oxidoreductase [Planctomycetota bacterium]
MINPSVDDRRYPAADVLVAGGGMAGIAAAIAAARTGATTLLVERAGWLGGMGITGATGLHTFYNVFDAHPGAERTRLVAGIAQELVDRVQQLGGGVGHVRMERGGDFISMLTPVEPEAFKLAAFQLCREAGVRLLLHTVLDEVRASGGHVEGVVVWNKAGRSLVRAKQYVDCTGDGDLAAWAGAPFEHYKPGDPGAYSAGFTFRLVNVDLTAMEADLDRRGLITQLAHAVKPGTTTPDLVRLGIHMGKLREVGATNAPGYFLACSLRPRELTYCNCINHGPNDGLDPDALTEAEAALRGRMFEVADMFRNHIAGCEGCYPAGPAPSAGQRRARAIRCDYELSQDDVTEGRQFDDQVGLFGFIDNGRFFVREAGAYGIPYRALIPRGLDNVLIAGRMMTVELVAHNSTRNTVCCLVCGQAAGTAAALSAARDIAPRGLDPADLRGRLACDGVLLQPRFEPLCA